MSNVSVFLSSATRAKTIRFFSTENCVARPTTLSPIQLSCGPTSASPIPIRSHSTSGRARATQNCIQSRQEMPPNCSCRPPSGHLDLPTVKGRRSVHRKALPSSFRWESLRRNCLRRLWKTENPKSRYCTERRKRTVWKLLLRSTRGQRSRSAALSNEILCF